VFARSIENARKFQEISDPIILHHHFCLHNLSSPAERCEVNRRKETTRRCPEAVEERTSNLITQPRQLQVLDTSARTSRLPSHSQPLVISGRGMMMMVVPLLLLMLLPLSVARHLLSRSPLLSLSFSDLKICVLNAASSRK
jgi:hypothetical protein